MMHCPQCQQENPLQAKFCLECGTRLVLTCAQCGTELPGSAKFCLACGQRALALVTAGGEGVLQALANQHLGIAYHTQGDYRRAMDCLRQTVVSLDETRRYERFGLPILPSVNSRTFLTMCHAELGTFAEGVALGNEGFRIAEAVAHSGSLMMASWGIGLLALRQGDLHRALPQLERAMGLCQDMDFPGNFPRIAAHLGAAYTLGRRIADAVSLLMQAMEQTMATKMVGFQAHCSLLLGEAQVLAGRLDDAHALAARALMLARERQERGHAAYTLGLLGDIAAHRAPPDVDQAATHYRQALTLAEELSMRPLQAHCRHGLGTLYATVGQRQQARVALTTAIEMYRAMDMTFWLPQAEAVLAQVEERP